jgi:hypothetical protein
LIWVNVQIARNEDKETENAAFVEKKDAKAVSSFSSVLLTKGKLDYKIFMPALKTALMRCQERLSNKFRFLP